MKSSEIKTWNVSQCAGVHCAIWLAGSILFPVNNSSIIRRYSAFINLFIKDLCHRTVLSDVRIPGGEISEKFYTFDFNKMICVHLEKKNIFLNISPASKAIKPLKQRCERICERMWKSVKDVDWCDIANNLILCLNS